MKFYLSFFRFGLAYNLNIRDTNIRDKIPLVPEASLTRNTSAGVANISARSN